MKARIKATGEIVEVIAISDYINENGQIIGEYKDGNGMLYTSYDLDFYIEEGITIPDYWTRLEHQYAGMAMQGMLNNSYLAGEFRKDPNNGIEDMSKIITKAAAVYAHALVEKLKEKEERK